MELELAKSLVLVFLEQQRNENVHFMLSVAHHRCIIDASSPVCIFTA